MWEIVGLKDYYLYDLYFFFFKQKTAYEIKECDWSSDVCSSDLRLDGLLAAYLSSPLGCAFCGQDGCVPVYHVHHAHIAEHLEAVAAAVAGLPRKIFPSGFPIRPLKFLFAVEKAFSPFASTP